MRNSEKNSRVPLFEEWAQVPHKQMLYRVEQELLQLVLSGMHPPHWIFTQGSELLHILFAVLDDKRNTNIQQWISEGKRSFYLLMPPQPIKGILPWYTWIDRVVLLGMNNMYKQIKTKKNIMCWNVHTKSVIKNAENSVQWKDSTKRHYQVLSILL